MDGLYFLLSLPSRMLSGKESRPDSYRDSGLGRKDIQPLPALQLCGKVDRCGLYNWSLLYAFVAGSFYQLQAVGAFNFLAVWSRYATGLQIYTPKNKLYRLYLRVVIECWSHTCPAVITGVVLKLNSSTVPKRGSASRVEVFPQKK